MGMTGFGGKILELCLTELKFSTRQEGQSGDKPGLQVLTS